MKQLANPYDRKKSNKYIPTPKEEEFFVQPKTE